MPKDREIELHYRCDNCAVKVIVTSEEKLFDIVNTQACAENRKLLCDKCND